MTIGQKIMSMRKARGWSQEELAERIGVTRQAVSRWEADSSKPDAEKIIAVCDLFGVSADYLLRESYQGEEGSAAAADKTTALGKFIRGMNLKQWINFAVFAAGILIMAFMRILYVVASLNDRVSSFFPDFINEFQLFWSWLLSIACILYGFLTCIFLPALNWALRQEDK